jgi:hypothetical protein
MKLKSRILNLGCTFLAVCLFLPTGASAVVIVSDAGADVAAITDTVDAFRAALGDPNNGNNPGPLATGRREINWDGGGPPVIDGTPPVTPFVVFRNTRGATFTTPGTGLTQAAATGGLLSLDLINPQYAQLFAPFSLNRLFTPIGSNVTEGFFAIPNSGGAAPAGVSGFGVVFSDVDLAGTSIGLINHRGESLGSFSVPTYPGNQTFSFLGLLAEPGDGLIAGVTITTGTTPLGPSEAPGIDLVVMDDFLFGEPRLIPEPSTSVLLSSALLVMAALAWRRSRRG